MTKLIGNLVFGQSGGPTSVINSSAAGVFLEALDHPELIQNVYGMRHGIEGVLRDELYDIGKEDRKELEYLTGTPSSILGTCRYKIASPEVDDTDLRRIHEVLAKRNIRYFFYNGGNDSMDTCMKVERYLKAQEYECRVIGIPKTIDNDLFGTDHCPGFGSSARYLATAISEVWQDAHSYSTPMAIVFECMGRHAGWLAGASALAGVIGHGPDLIYLPEVPFDFDQMHEDARQVLKKKNVVMISVSEGIMTADGTLVAEQLSSRATDSFGHKQLGGVASMLADEIADELGLKVRGIEFSLLQRCAAHAASGRDIEEALLAGRSGVKAALDGVSGVMIGFKRAEGEPYRCEIIHVPLAETANKEKVVPREWINEAGNYVTQDFIDYALPLIDGEPHQKHENGLPRFARLKKIRV
ncbi:MAG: 6-phosphofructokinase [Clostridiaceae bacterium]|jgi:6-phosphofructokinase|nr:6-phosphofructokinase [Clostridia bacterium]MBP6949643.1 6-phosphofructokinase [Clostridia bacterium]NMA35536.1 6-phosphofructokinase [Clostridiaceae bacterium]HPY64631.1 6-phosphofructokinase [Bacillota bacterium]